MMPSLRSQSVAALLTILPVLFAAAAAAEGPLIVGDVISASIDSPHPYPPGGAEPTLVWQTTVGHPGATFMKLHFARLDLGDADDYVLVRDPRTGKTETLREAGGVDGTWSNLVPGHQLVVELYADAAAEAYGVLIDLYSFGTLDIFEVYGSRAQEEFDNAVCNYRRITCSPRVARGRPVGALFVTGQTPQAHTSFCTGFLVNHEGACRLMTNNHCVPANACNATDVFFNYARDCNTGALLPFDGPYRCANIAAQSPREQLDFSKLDLQWAGPPPVRDPCQVWGTAPLGVGDPVAVGDELFLIGHPAGFSMQISEQPGDANCAIRALNLGTCGSGTRPATYMGHRCDTQGGSSGSAIFNRNDRVVALHKGGDDCANVGDANNCGVPIGLIKGGVTPVEAVTWGSLKAVYR